MTYRNKYAKDPRWIEARFAGTCQHCHADIPRGARAYYFPNGKTILCEKCGKSAANEFNSQAFDEEHNRSL